MQQRTLLNLLCGAFALSLFGFFVDGDVRHPSLVTNGLEILLMTVVLFTALLVPYALYCLVRTCWHRKRPTPID